MAGDPIVDLIPCGFPFGCIVVLGGKFERFFLVFAWMLNGNIAIPFLPGWGEMEGTGVSEMDDGVGWGAFRNLLLIRCCGCFDRFD